MARCLNSRGISPTIAHRTQNCVPIAHLELSCDPWSLLSPTWERRGCRLSLGIPLIFIGYSEKKMVWSHYMQQSLLNQVLDSIYTYNQRPSSVDVLSPLCALSMVANTATCCRLLLPGVISGSGNASTSHFSDIDFSEEKSWCTFLFLCATIVPSRRPIALFPMPSFSLLCLKKKIANLSMFVCSVILKN